MNAERQTFSQFLFQKCKMLRFRQSGFNPFLSARSNLDASAEIVRAVLDVSAEIVHEVSDISVENVRAVKGDALIHGPYLAARPVGSDWRTRRPSQLIQTYC
jgi:hypothetical protein